jgi:hypothetical protein
LGWLGNFFFLIRTIEMESESVVRNDLPAGYKAAGECEEGV